MRPFKLPSHRRQERAIALVLVLWALFVLCMVVLGLAQQVNQEFLVVGRDQRALEARALAYSGVEVALHPLATVKTKELTRQIDATHGYKARITGEGGKLNLNWLLVGEDPRKLQVLKNYLEIKGMAFQQREQFVDCLLDWVDQDNVPHLNGSETGLDGLPAPNRPLQDLSEIKRIKGNQPLTALPHWEDDFTLLSRGPIDLQWASEDVVASLPGVGTFRAHGFIQQRQGEDKLDGTADDRLLESAQQAMQFLGMGPQEAAGVQDLISIREGTVRIVSVGKSINFTKTLEVVARKESSPPQILLWKEF